MNSEPLQQGASCKEEDGSSRDESAHNRIDVELGVACNSASMGVAFLHGDMKTPMCIMIRQRCNDAGGQTPYTNFCRYGCHHSWDPCV